MDSEDDMLDAHDMESGEDDFYSGGTDDYNDSYDDNDDDYNGFVEETVDDSTMIASHLSQVGSTSSYLSFLWIFCVFRACYVFLAFADGQCWKLIFFFGQDNCSMALF